MRDEDGGRERAEALRTFIFLYFTSGSYQPKAECVQALTLSLLEKRKGKGLKKKKKDGK